MSKGFCGKGYPPTHRTHRCNHQGNPHPRRRKGRCGRRHLLACYGTRLAYTFARCRGSSPSRTRGRSGNHLPRNRQSNCTSPLHICYCGNWSLPGTRSRKNMCPAHRDFRFQCMLLLQDNPNPGYIACHNLWTSMSLMHTARAFHIAPL